MSNTKVRQVVFDAIKPPKELTIRSVVEWFKTAITTVNEQEEQLTPSEQAYVDGAWVGHCAALAQELEVPVGWLSAALSELGMYEMRLLATAKAEAQRALATADLEQLVIEGGGENFEEETTPKA